MKRILVISFTVLAIGLLVASLFRQSDISKEIGGHTWSLVRLTVDGSEVPLPGDAVISLVPMGGKRYVGNASVNTYEVHFSVNRKGEITFENEDSGVTEMAGPPHLMAIEESYLDAFWKVQSAEVSGSTFVLKGAGVRLDYQGKPALPRDRSGSPADTVSTMAEE